MSDNNDKSDEGLIRTIGPKALGTNVFNMVVGAGIFALPGLVAAILGPAAVIAYIICAFAIGMIFLCYAEVGSRITRSGGSYAYIEEAFGPFIGFISSTLLWFGWAVASDAAILVAMIGFISVVVPELNEPLWRILFIISLLTFMTVTNIVGVKSGVRLYIFNTIAKFIPLALLFLVGIFYINFDNLVIPELPSFSSIGAATLILIFAFSGAECALNASGEIKNPEKTVPRGLLLGISCIFILYLGLQSVAQGVLGADLVNNADAPLAAAAQEIFGSWGGKLVLVGSVISIFGTISGDVLATPRVIFAASRDGHLPEIFSKVHPKYKTPYASIILYSSMIGVLAMSGQFKSLAVLASGSILIVYAGVSLSVLKIRARDGMPSGNQFTLPFGPLIPILSCVVIGWLLWHLTMDEALALLALIGISIVIYLFMRMRKTKNAAG